MLNTVLRFSVLCNITWLPSFLSKPSTQLSISMVNSKIFSISFSVRYSASRLVKPIIFLIFSWTLWFWEILILSSIAFVCDPEVTHKIYKIIGTDLVSDCRQSSFLWGSFVYSLKVTGTLRSLCIAISEKYIQFSQTFDQCLHFFLVQIPYDGVDHFPVEISVVEKSFSPLLCQGHQHYTFISGAAVAGEISFSLQTVHILSLIHIWRCRR